MQEYAQIGREIPAAFAIQCLGMVEKHQGHFKDAHKHAYKALEMGQKNEEFRVQGYALLDLAQLAIEGGKWQEAFRMLETAETHYVKAAHHSAISRIRLQKARIDLAVGNISRAFHSLAALRQIFQNSEESSYLLQTDLVLLDLLRESGRPYEAEILSQKIEQKAEFINFPRLQALSQESLFFKKSRQKIKSLQAAIRLWHICKDPRAVLRCRIKLAAYGITDSNAFEDLLNEAMEQENKRMELQILLLLAQRELDVGNFAIAESWLDYWREKMFSYSTIFEQWQGDFLCGKLLCTQDSDSTAGKQFLKTTLSHFVRIGHINKVLACLVNLPTPTLAEEELMLLLQSYNCKDILDRSWKTSMILALIKSNRLLISLPQPPKMLLKKFLEPWSEAPGSDNLTTLALYHIREVIRQEKK